MRDVWKLPLTSRSVSIKMKNIIIPTETEAQLEKGVSAVSFTLILSLILAFVVSLVMKKSLEYIFKNLVKV